MVGEPGAGSRDVQGFSEIVLDGGGRVAVTMTGSGSLTIEAEDNLIPDMKVEVRNGRLTIETTGPMTPPCGFSTPSPRQLSMQPPSADWFSRPVTSCTDSPDAGVSGAGSTRIR
jgi:hypothetical protein